MYWKEYKYARCSDCKCAAECRTSADKSTSAHVDGCSLSCSAYKLASPPLKSVFEKIYQCPLSGVSGQDLFRFFFASHFSKVVNFVLKPPFFGPHRCERNSALRKMRLLDQEIFLTNGSDKKTYSDYKLFE